MKIYILLLSLSSSTIIYANRVNEILNTPIESVAKIDVKESNTTTLIPSHFAENSLQLSKIYQHLKSVSTYKIYYVFTQFKKEESFSQATLNLNRIKTFYNSFPFLVEDPFIEWKFISQTGCQSPSECSNFFHGFIIIHTSKNIEELRIEEEEKLNQILSDPFSEVSWSNPDPIESQLPINTTSNSTNLHATSNNADTTCIDAFYTEGGEELFTYIRNHLSKQEEISLKRIDKWVDFTFVVGVDGKLDSLLFGAEVNDFEKEIITDMIEQMPSWTPKKCFGTISSSHVNMSVRVSYNPQVKGMCTINGKRPDFGEETSLTAEETELTAMLPNQTVQGKDLKKNALYTSFDQFISDQTFALVMDVTGSMSEHIATTVRWLAVHKHQLPFTSFTFFNDGDGKSTSRKKIGSTGGVYLTLEYSSFNETLKKCMHGGSGGEAPENDIEALLEAQKADKEATAFLLVGDNYSEVRDIELLSKIDKPVYVFLCGNSKIIRPEYLTIVVNTGGKLIFQGQEIDLTEAFKKDKFELHGAKYIYKNQAFEFK